MLFHSLLVASRRMLASRAVAKRVPLLFFASMLGALTLAASQAAQTNREAPTSGRLGPSLATTHYSVVNLHHVLGTARSSQYPKVLAINRGGRVLLTGDGVTLSSAGYVVNKDGSHVELMTGCPACDPNDYNVAEALALNDASEIVGLWLDDSSSAVPVINYGANWALHGETTASVSGIVPGRYAFGNEYAVNDLGTAVGISGSTLPGGGQGPITAYDFKTGRFLGTFGAANACDVAGSPSISEATAINDAGVIVGDASATTSCATTVAARFPLSGPTVALPVAAPSKAIAINASGTVVGYAGGNGGPGTRAFLYALGNGPAPIATTATYLPFPVGYSAAANTEIARGIDSEGDVVGDVYGSACSACGLQLVAGFLYTGGHAYDLNALLPPRSGWHIFDAVGISDDGAIVGTGTFKNESNAPFLMRPLATSSIELRL